MAGIGFELRRLLAAGTYSSVLKAFGTAGLIGAGPLAISVIGIFSVGLLTSSSGLATPFVAQFQLSVTYLMAGSLIFTSPFQLMLARFVADCLFRREPELILPNLLGVSVVVTIGGGALALALITCCFGGSWLYRILMLSGFLLLNNIWLVITLLSSVKAWRMILAAFALGYGATVGLAYGLKGYGLDGLILGFIVGQGLLFLLVLVALVRSYPLRSAPCFAFVESAGGYATLALAGLVHSIAVWADKFIFWADPRTGVELLGALRYSPIYDTPVFIAYLSLIPGMAVFLLRVETDFAEKYDAYYGAIRAGCTLAELMRRKAEMALAIREGLFDLVKVQGAFALILIWAGDGLLGWLGISTLQKPLFDVFIVAVWLQLLLMAINNVLYWFDKQVSALWLALLFLSANSALTHLSLLGGVAFYGYGFALALMLTSGVGLLVLRRTLDDLEYETFMLQKVRV
ncbi:exopolysaccharide Pel transporter PelG [Thiocystis violacea]|uniref:exopolysaccharide Pel transporter PelG n=1 Tax=Thiocystis violacea TaxID=13725 RepID=UPI001907D88F